MSRAFNLNPMRIPVPGAENFERQLADGIPRSVSAPRITSEKSETIFTICILVFSTGAFVNLFPGEQGLEHREEGILFAQILWSSLYIGFLFLVRKRILEFARLIWYSKSLLMILAWTCFSLLWSINRQVTVRHSIAFLFTSLVGVYFGCRYDLREQLRLVAIALGIVVVSSVVACLVFPQYGITTDYSYDEPAWQGVLSAKNNLATLLILATLILLVYFVGRIRPLAALAGIILVFGLVIPTQSTAALVYFVLAIVVFPLVRAFQRNPRRRRRMIMLGSLLFGSLVSWVCLNWETFMAYLGKDPGFTGRFVLWGLSFIWIRERPFLGHGYGAFWSDFYGPAADFRIASGWLEATHAHNGFINLWLDLGLIGVLLFILGFVISYRRALILATTTKAVEGIWPITVLTFLFVYSLTEISFLGRNDLYWILYVSMTVALQMASPKFSSLESPRFSEGSSYATE
jgi:O-antigen ligase